MTKKELLDRCARDGAERVLLARVLDKLELAQDRGIPAHTPFLSPGKPPQKIWRGCPQALSKSVTEACSPGERKGVWAGMPRS